MSDTDVEGADVPAGDRPKLYWELASWFHLLTAPEEYVEEAELYRRLLNESSQSPPSSVLELGSGGGNNASHMKEHLDLTLVDLSPEMLEMSRSLNPECEHVVGDMRTIRLDRAFDAVFVHDAIDYIITEPDLRLVIETAFVHCRPGGVALFVPDFVRERFRPRTEHGGNDGGGRGIRYLEWSWDPEPEDTWYLTDFAYLLRDESGTVRAEHDRHVCGLFGRDSWLRLLAEVGFDAQAHTVREAGEPERDLFVASRRG